MEKIFLDCGTHLCEGILKFHELGIIDETYKIHAFEANPECNIVERVKQLPNEIIPHEVAVWDSDGVIQFRQENHKISNEWYGQKKSPTDGYSDIDGWASSAADVRLNYPGLDTVIHVKSIDFDRFVRELPKAEKIICKFDIEGSEYRIVRKMIDTGTISRIDELYVEFHQRFMDSETPESTEFLINQLKSLGVYAGDSPRTYGVWK